MNKLTAYVEKFGLLSLEKQDKLAQVINDHIFELDLEAGFVRFNDIQFRYQVLGTESDNTLTWLWAWAEEQEEIPESLIRAAHELQDWGTQQEIQEFVIPSVDLTRADGMLFSLIASEVCKASCYYRDQYEGGSLFILLFDTLIENQPAFDLARLSRQLQFLISNYEINHRNALLSYLTIKGFTPIQGASRIACPLPTGELLSAEFDAEGRLKTLGG
jgi:hypothetical protein